MKLFILILVIANHVPVVLTALPVHRVVHILQILVLLGLMQIVQHTVVIHVQQENTVLPMPQVVFRLVLLEPVPVMAQHRVDHVPLQPQTKRGGLIVLGTM